MKANVKKLIFLSILIFPFLSQGQKIKELQGKVCVKGTNKPVRYASVWLMKEEYDICNTEESGVFSFISPNFRPNDTLFVRCQGYNSAKVTIRQLIKNSTIELEPIPKRPLQKVKTNNKYPNNAILNMFDKTAVRYYTGVERQWERFKYLQLAQQFNAPANSIALKAVSILRLTYSGVTNGEETKFRLHIYDIATSGTGPGDELSDEEIIVHNSGSKVINFNLPSKINIKGAIFFVAIEWLRVNYNRCVITSATHFSHRQVDEKCYLPIIGMSNIKGGSINTWGMDLSGNWKPYTYFSPDLTDFAISAEVEY